jgi:uncharacterized protein YggT (Ycf19 family)
MAQPLHAVAQLVDFAFRIFYILLLIRVVFSFLRLPRWHWASRTIGRWSETITEPVLVPVRRLLDPYQARSGLDFSPLVVWLVAEWIVRPLLLRLLLG